MPLIERENVSHGMPLCQHYDRRIGQSDAQVLIPVDDLYRSRYVCSRERLEPIGSANDFFKKGSLGRWTDMAAEKIVELRENEWRQEQGPGGLCQRSGAGGVMTLTRVDSGK